MNDLPCICGHDYDAHSHHQQCGSTDCYCQGYEGDEESEVAE